MVPTPRQLRSLISKTLETSFCAARLPVAIQHSRVLVLDFRASGFELPNRHQRSLKNIERLKPRDDDRNFIFCADRFIVAVSHNGADMSGTEESLHAIFRRLQDCLERGRNQHMRHQNGNIA